MLERYLRRYPREVDRLRPIVWALELGRDVTSRREFRGGHVTCGAVVLDDRNRLLTVRHVTLGRWLLPGGHVETWDESLELAALRELEEETGIPRQHAAQLVANDSCPIEIGLHAIPASSSKSEPAHWHADFRFAFKVVEPTVRLQTDEVAEHAWRAPGRALTKKLALRNAEV